MKLILTLILALGMLPACQGLGRYGSRQGDLSQRSTERETNSDRRDSQSIMTTKQSIALGTILQASLGKPYVGRSVYEQGVDCSMFTRDAYRKFAGADLPRTAEGQFSAGQPVKSADIAYGDLVFFKVTGNEISHVGIYIGYNEFIHASTSRGIIISKLSDGYWSRRYAGARRPILEQSE